MIRQFIAFVLFLVFSFISLILFIASFRYYRAVKTYGMKDFSRDWIQKKRNLYFTLFIWSFDITGFCLMLWLI